jgi:metal-dependent amidase/aminoacylase/carboxypeptidase family protein
MKANYFILSFFFYLSSYSAGKELRLIKKQYSLCRKASARIQLSDQIWEYAETAMKETKSSKVLSDYAKAQGFTTTGVAEIQPLLLEYGMVTIIDFR